MTKRSSGGWITSPFPTQQMREAEARKVAELLEQHRRYIMTGEGSVRKIRREIGCLQRQGYIDREMAEILRSTMIPSDAEYRLHRIVAGVDPEIVYDNPWKKLVHLIAYSAWFAGFGCIIEVLLSHVMKSVEMPNNVFLAIVPGVAGLYAWIWISSVAHSRTTGRLIERLFETR